METLADRRRDAARSWLAGLLTDEELTAVYELEVSEKGRLFETQEPRRFGVNRDDVERCGASPKGGSSRGGAFHG